MTFTSDMSPASIACNPIRSYNLEPSLHVPTILRIRPIYTYTSYIIRML